MIAQIIKSAQINRNLGHVACHGFARRRNLDMRLVRLACRLDAENRLQKLIRSTPFILPAHWPDVDYVGYASPSFDRYEGFYQ